MHESSEGFGYMGMVDISWTDTYTRVLRVRRGSKSGHYKRHVLKRGWISFSKFGSCYMLAHQHNGGREREITLIIKKLSIQAPNLARKTTTGIIYNFLSYCLNFVFCVRQRSGWWVTSIDIKPTSLIVNEVSFDVKTTISRKRGNSHKRAYVSFIQYKNLPLIGSWPIHIKRLILD